MPSAIKIRLGLAGKAAIAGGTLLVSPLVVAAIDPPPSIQVIREINRGQDLQHQLRQDNQPVIKRSLPEGASAPSEANELRFVMPAAEVEGATLVSRPEIDGILQPWIGKPVSLAKLASLAEALTAVYRAKGYTLSQVVLPPQRIKPGMALRFIAIEAVIGSVEVTGDATDQDPLILSKLNHLIDDPTITIERIEEAMLLVRDLEGVEAEGRLEPGESDGRLRLVVDVKRDSVSGILTYHNMNSSTLGRHRAMITAQVNNLFGRQDYTQISATRTTENDEASAINLMHGIMLGNRGTRMEFSYAHSVGKPGESLKPFDLYATANIYGVQVTHPIKRSRDLNVRIHGGFEYLSSEFDAARHQFKLIEEKLGSLLAGATIDWRDHVLSDASTIVKLDLRHGLGSHSSLPSRLNGDPYYTSFRFLGIRNQAITSLTSLQVGVGGQYAFDPLLVGEQYSIGSYPFGRGYDPSQLISDHALAGKLELRVDITDHIAKILGIPAPNLNIATFGFYDRGHAWNYDEKDTRRLTSTGIGVRGSMIAPAGKKSTDYKSLDFETFVAWGLDAPISEHHGGPTLRGRMVLNF